MLRGTSLALETLWRGFLDFKDNFFKVKIRKKWQHFALEADELKQHSSDF